MGKSGEFFTFDEVLKKLQIDETRLKRLVSEGEIRAFREGDEMKFRRADVENLGGADQFLAMSAAWALAQIDPKCDDCAPKTVPVLIKALDEPDAITRVHAVQALGALGPLAEDAVPALKKTLEDEIEDIRAVAAKALEAIGQ